MHRYPGSAARRLAAALAVITPVAAGLLIASPASPASADDPAAPRSAAIGDDYIVVLKDDAATRTAGVQVRAREVTEHTGTRPGYIYRHALRGFTVRATPDQAKEMAADPAVASVEKDRTITLDDDLLDPSPKGPDRNVKPTAVTEATQAWGLDRIDQRRLPLDSNYSYTTTADNVRAYVIDSGIAFGHPEFGGRATSGYDFVDNDDDASDCNGHGTAAAGVLGGTNWGVAKGVRLVGVRVIDCKGEGSVSAVIAAIDWITANAVKPAVVNASGGVLGISAAVETAVTNSIASGVTFVAAAGNSDIDACGLSPGRLPAVITVGSTTKTDARMTKSTKSNWGPCLNIFAPGDEIISALYSDPKYVVLLSGTSAAAPHVAGAAALYLSKNPTATPAQVQDAIVKAGTKGVVTEAGTGSPNVLLYTGP